MKAQDNFHKESWEPVHQTFLPFLLPSLFHVNLTQLLVSYVFHDTNV